MPVYLPKPLSLGITKKIIREEEKTGVLPDFIETMDDYIREGLRRDGLLKTSEGCLHENHTSFNRSHRSTNTCWCMRCGEKLIFVETDKKGHGELKLYREIGAKKKPVGEVPDLTDIKDSDVVFDKPADDDRTEKKDN